MEFGTIAMLYDNENRRYESTLLEYLIQSIGIRDTNKSINNKQFLLVFCM